MEKAITQKCKGARGKLFVDNPWQEGALKMPGTPVALRFKRLCGYYAK
jgi:hypothetical protein